MSDPIQYNPDYSYSDWQASNPAKPLPAPQVDNDLANVSSAINNHRLAIMDVRRSDGALKNNSVGPDQLRNSSVTKNKLAFGYLDTDTKATEAEAAAGITNTPYMTPHLTSIHISANVPAIIPKYINISEAASVSIASGVKRMRTDFYTTSYAPYIPALQNGGAYYRRATLTELGGYPARAYFRTQDRYMPNGDVDGTEGGYWLIDEPVPNVAQFGAVPDGATDCTVAFQAAAHFKAFFVPPGVWAISSPITLPSKAKMRGAGTEVTTVLSNVIGDSLVKTSVDTIFVGISDMTLQGNNLTGSSGNGHAINFIDPVSSSGTFSPQQAVLERLRIKNFRGQDIRRTGVATTVCAAGVIMHNALQNICRDVYINDCGHGFYMEATQNCRIVNCAVDNCDKFALIAYNNENLIVAYGDFVVCGDGTVDAGYPATSFSWGSATILDYANQNFVFYGNKVKNNYAGTSLFRSFSSQGSVYDSNWIRPDSVTNVAHKAFYIQESYGTQIVNNEFHPANSGFTGQKYEMIELYNTQSASTMMTRIEGNTFGDVGTMGIAYNIKVGGNSNARSQQVIIEGNSFGFNLGRSTTTTVDADIVIASCALHACRIKNNLHIASANVTRTVCVTASTFTEPNNDNDIGPSRMIANGGTISGTYSGIRTSVIKFTSAIENPANLTTGSETSFTHTVTGAAFGDVVEVGYSADPKGCEIFSRVSAADTVVTKIRNNTGSSQDLASGVFYYTVRRP